MNRTTWGAVLITVLVLAGAGFASRLSWRSGAVLVEQSRSVAGRAAALLERGAHGLGSLHGSWTALPGPVRSGTAGGAGLLLLLALAIARHRRHPNRVALRMLRRGGAPPRVARRTRMSRDAIRALSHTRNA